MKYFNYLAGLTMTNRRFDRPVRRPAARRRSPRSRSARWTSPRRSRWSPRRSCCAWPAHAAPDHRRAQRSVWPAAWRSTAWPTAASCAKGRSTTSGSSPPPATPAARSAPRCTAWHQILGKPRTRRRACTTRCRARTSGPAFSSDEIAAWLDAPGLPLRTARRRGAGAAHRAARSRTATSSACCRDAWSSGRARSGTARSSAMPARRRCSRS